MFVCLSEELEYQDDDIFKCSFFKVIHLQSTLINGIDIIGGGLFCLTSVAIRTAAPSGKPDSAIGGGSGKVSPRSRIIFPRVSAVISA